MILGSRYVQLEEKCPTLVDYTLVLTPYTRLAKKFYLEVSNINNTPTLTLNGRSTRKKNIVFSAPIITKFWANICTNHFK